MTFQALDAYLERLNHTARSQQSKVWLDPQGRAIGRYFNTSLTSAFQPVRSVGDGAIVAHEAFARSYSEFDSGLHLWKLLDQAASDDESVALDRLCRMLHAINFYRQSDAGDASADELHLSVHARLLAAVNSNHGAAYRRVLSLLEVPHQRIVLQLPAVTPNQRWLLSHVLENYRRNGFRLGVSANSALEALGLLDKVQPDLIKVDARELADPDSVGLLLLRAAEQGVRVFFKRVENAEVAQRLAQFGSALGRPVLVQGYLWDKPQALLVRGAPAAAAASAAAAGLAA